MVINLVFVCFFRKQIELEIIKSSNDQEPIKK